MKNTDIEIDAIKRNIKVTIPFEIKRKMNKEDEDYINEKVFDIAIILNKISNRTVDKAK